MDKLEHLPFSQACENNKDPILKAIKPLLTKSKKVLEIGSGTGQHACYFAPALAHLSWLCSDLALNHEAISQWQSAYPSPNLLGPIELDMSAPIWPQDFDAVYSANTAHIMPWELTQKMVLDVGARLPSKGWFLLYGPFNYGGRYTSESNADFDQWLKAQDSRRGLRNFEDLNALAEQHNLHLVDDQALPANNHLLAWQKA